MTFKNLKMCRFIYLKLTYVNYIVIAVFNFRHITLFCEEKINNTISNPPKNIIL